jgi:hypothetical protein
MLNDFYLTPGNWPKTCVAHLAQCAAGLLGSATVSGMAWPVAHGHEASPHGAVAAHGQSSMWWALAATTIARLTASSSGLDGDVVFTMMPKDDERMCRVTF